MKEKNTAVIQYRVKGKGSFLPKRDKAWTEFCTVIEDRTKPSAVFTVVNALNFFMERENYLFEYRVLLP